jgi:hypothetical protein
MEKAGLLDVAIAPLTWLERSKGWKRRGLVVLYLAVLSTVGVLGWRGLSLWRLPDVGEPFDVERFGTVRVADSDNALPLYLEAQKRIKPLDAPQKALDSKAWKVDDWAGLDPELKRWVVESRPAIEPWLRAAERADALQVQPGEMRVTSILDATQKIRELAQLAIREGSRLEHDGDLEGAWRIYRAILRSSRHAGRHGGAMQRLVGHSVLVVARAPIGRWIEDPAVPPVLLRRAIDDVEACQAMTSPNSEMVRAEYFACRDALDRPEEWRKFDPEGPEGDAMWYNQFPILGKGRHFLLREPERSQRVLRLITAGLLAQCDRPRLVRPKLFSSKYMIYEVDERTPPAVAAITPEELSKGGDRSAFSTLWTSINLVLTRIDFEQGIFDDLRVRMAGRAYEIERGKPAATYGDLLGHYLKALPEGFEPGDAASTPSEPK